LNAGAGAWSIINSVIFNKNVLVNQSKKIGNPFHTKLLYEKYECVNGRVNVNVWFNDDLTNDASIAVIFRYIKIGSEEMYYYVKINQISISLNLFKNGSMQNLHETPNKFNKNIIYRISIIYEVDQIDV